MKSVILFVVVIVASILWSADWSLAQCPENPWDNGLCDTLYVEVFPPDTIFTGPGHLVRVPIFATHDVPDPDIDSIAGMLIPLCFTHTNVTKFCSASYYWNTLAFTEPELDRSIFRNLNGVQNWMLDLYEQDPSYVWANTIRSLDGTSHFWLVLVPTIQPLMGTVNHQLLATITFRVQDTMTICIDSCFWPPSDRLGFSRSDAVIYIPRHNLPCCFSISCPSLGNFNGDCKIDLGDLVYLISYLYRDGPAPDPLELGDTNCDGAVDLGDMVFLIKYVYKSGPVPAC